MMLPRNYTGSERVKCVVMILFNLEKFQIILKMVLLLKYKIITVISINMNVKIIKIKLLRKITHPYFSFHGG